MSAAGNKTAQKRRRKGEGGVRYRNGRYEVCVDLGRDENGKRIRKTATGMTIKEAKRRLDQRVRDYYSNQNHQIMEEKIIVNNHEQTVEDTLIENKALKDIYKQRVYDVALRYVNEFKRMSIRSSSLSSYATRLKYIERYFKNMYIQDVTAKDIRVLLHLLTEDNNSVTIHSKALCKGNIKAFLHFLVSVFDYAKRELHIIEKDIFKENMIKLPKDIKANNTVHEVEAEIYMQYLKISEEKEKTPFINTLLTVLLFTGIRIGELCGLKKEDCHPQDGYIKIQRAIANQPLWSDDMKNSVQDFKETNLKTEFSCRIVPCDDIVFQKIHILRESYKTMPFWEKIKGTEYENFIFLSRTGKFQRPNNIYVRLNDFAKRNNLPAITLHRLRHTYATTLIRGGAIPKSVSSLLGHSDPTMVLRVYADTSEEDKREASKIGDRYYHNIFSQMSDVKE